jgi:hypothetical protein
MAGAAEIPREQLCHSHFQGILTNYLWIVVHGKPFARFDLNPELSSGRNSFWFEFETMVLEYWFNGELMSKDVDSTHEIISVWTFWQAGRYFFAT